MTDYPFFGHIIDNEEVESLDGKRFDTINPWTREKWAEVAEASAADADRATGHQRLASRERERPDSQLAVMPAYEMPEPNPAGSVHLTARDLAAWMKFHLAGGVVGDRRL